MSDALSELNGMIERVRTEAEAAGYARAWAEIRDIAAAHAAGHPAEGDAANPSEAPSPFSHTSVNGRRYFSSSSLEHPLPKFRASRGENKGYVEKAIRDSPRSLNAREIQRYIADQSSHIIAYSSIQQALSQLEDGAIIVRGSDSRYRLVPASAEQLDSHPD